MWMDNCAKPHFMKTLNFLTSQYFGLDYLTAREESKACDALYGRLTGVCVKDMYLLWLLTCEYLLI